MKRESYRGSMMLTVVFSLFLFFASSTLLTYTITHIGVSRARAKTIRHLSSLHQDMVYYLHSFRETVFSNQFREFSDPEKAYFNDNCFPRMTLSNAISKASIKFTYEQVPKPGTEYEMILIRPLVNLIEEEKASKTNFRLRAEICISLLSGKIPLDYIPILVQRAITSSEETFFMQNSVRNAGKGQLVAGDIPVELDFKGLLRDALTIPDNSLLFWREIRAKLGLEPGDEPIENGIYLLKEEGIIDAIFIQGDLNQLTFSTAPEINGQRIGFQVDSQLYETRYKPGENYFECWEQDVSQDTFFREKIIVNGNVGSIRQQGELAFSGYTHIMLYVAGKSLIDSDLRTESIQLNLEEVKITGLTLATGLEQLYGIGYGLEENSVTVTGQEDRELDISIVAEGKFINKSKKLRLRGSLFCKDLENKGKIVVEQKRSSGLHSLYFKTKEFKFIKGFQVEAVEEVMNE